ncbi:MAG: phenylacetate-CoA oxygenase subunit PaaJ [Ignavibacteriales bacterium]|nr:phenylacetate-CoA oxygenase subunit PaaJ [Ignavibacteriales bacterium]
MALTSTLSHTVEEVWKALDEVQDPEIPVLSLVDLKVVREIQVEGTSVTVRLVPTFAGCPAMETMRRDVERRLAAMGFTEVSVHIERSASWSTEQMMDSTKEKLRSFGIAPPPSKLESLHATLSVPVPCPFCESLDTRPDGEFGSTLCKQYFFCNACRQSFERFKPL